jgi:hypothetical protein
MVLSIHIPPSYGYLVFVRKGNNVETAMFAKFINEIATEPFIDALRNFILWATLIWWHDSIEASAK